MSNRTDRSWANAKMGKPKRKRTPAQKAHKKLMRKKYEWVFVNGKQKRVKRAPAVDGTPVEEFTRNNADPIWLLQNEMYEELYEWEQRENRRSQRPSEQSSGGESESVNDTLPF